MLNLDTAFFNRFMRVSQKVSKILEKGLGVKRVALVIEGMEINHAHIKLYPLHGVGTAFKPMVRKETIYFEKYEGYITTLHGPKIGIDELKKLSKKIQKKKEKK